jgi:sterol 3beta-glucosyltransferase
MKIALLTLGTRGDVQPYVGLGRASRERGHEITLSTGDNFASLAQEYGVQFIPVQPDFRFGRCHDIHDKVAEIEK